MRVTSVETAEVEVPSRDELIEKLTAPGEKSEIIVKDIRGVPCRIFRHALPTLRDLLEHSRKFGDFEYIRYEDEIFSYEGFYLEVARLAQVLVHNYGVQKGDRVGVAMRNYPEWSIAFYAITSIGGIATCLNALWNGEELAYGLELTGSKLMISDRERTERIVPHLEDLDLNVLSVRSPDFESDRIVSLPKALEGIEADALPAVELDPDEDALIIFTSGSTGHPKGAVSSHRAAMHALYSWNLDADIGSIRAGIERPNEPDEFQFSMLMAVPLFHVAGLHVGLMQSMLHGRRLVFMYKWDVMEGIEIIESQQITSFTAVPTMTGDLVRAAAAHGRRLESLIGVGGGGSPRSAEQVRSIDSTFENAAPGTGWGMTETNAIGTIIGGPDYLERPTSSGRVSAVLDIRIVDDGDRELPQGQAGHLHIRGSSMFREYWNSPMANAEAFVEGWFRTGDIARVDEEGFVFIVDRAKDIVIRGGENIGCGEVEDAIFLHPSVAETVVFGVPDERLGEEVATMIHLRPGKTLNADDLKTHLREHLAAFQIPAYVYFSSEPLPRIASGKFNKLAIRKEIVAALS